MRAVGVQEAVERQTKAVVRDVDACHAGANHGRPVIALFYRDDLGLLGLSAHRAEVGPRRERRSAGGAGWVAVLEEEGGNNYCCWWRGRGLTPPGAGGGGQ